MPLGRSHWWRPWRYAVVITAPRTPSDLRTGNTILSVRVHPLQSAEFDALNATLNAGDVAVLFAGANRIWEPAGVRWRIESIIHELARNAAAYDKIFRGEGADPLDVMLSIRGRTFWPMDGMSLY